MPISIETTIVRVANTVPVVGRSRLSALKSAFSPTARPRPARRPISAAAKPITNASRMTDCNSWRREAPIVRRVANSRVRWATVIEKVLKITKAPTKSAMPANDSRKYRMKLVNSTDSRSLDACWSPVRTVTPEPSASRISLWSCAGVTPSFAATEMASN